MQKDIKRAGVIVIGDEILSGRTQDTNTKTIALRLNEIGVSLVEVRVIPDNVDTIIETVKLFSDQFDYVFTTGGIGPTHDDKTAQSVAQAFAVELYKNQEAFDTLVAHYGSIEHMNDGRVKMAYVPKGATLIDNPVSAAPGFKIENVYVMAGVPKIMESMLDNIIPTLEGGCVIHTRQLIVNSVESALAPYLEDIENLFEDVNVGSYPKYKDGAPEVTIILRSSDETQLDDAFCSLENRLTKNI